MTDPRRLSEEDGLGRSLLLAAQDDRPSDDAKRRAMVALGVVGPLAPPPPAAPAAASGAGAAAPSVVAKVVATKVGAGTLVPWALALAVSGGGLWMVTAGRTGPEASAPSPVERSPAVKVEADKAPPPLPIAPPAPVEAPTPAPAVVVPVKAVRRAPVVVPLSREIELLDEARAELKAGRAEGAASALERYRAECPSGRLRPEAALIEIDRLLLLGERERAADAARAYLAEHGEVLAPRHRALLGEGP